MNTTALANYAPLSEVAHIAEVSTRTIRRWAAKGIVHVVYEPIICGRRSLYSIADVMEVRAARQRLTPQPRIAEYRQNEVH